MSPTSDLFTQRPEGVYCCCTDSETRVCTAVVDGAGVVTDYNEKGALTQGDWERYLDLVARLSIDAGLVLMSGSLPAIDGHGSYLDLIEAVGDRPLWVDTNGRGLAHLLAAPGRAALIKVNRAEAADALGVEVGDDRRIATVLSAEAECPAIVTLGPDGAIYCDGQGCEQVASPAVTYLVNPTGSGDAFFAGYAYSRFVGHRGIRESLGFAAACGASNAANLGAGQIDLESLGDYSAT